MQVATTILLQCLGAVGCAPQVLLLLLTPACSCRLQELGTQRSMGPRVSEAACWVQVPGTISPGPFQQFNCIINTVVSLLGATVITFIASAFVGEKFDMVNFSPLAAGSPTPSLLARPWPPYIE